MDLRAIKARCEAATPGPWGYSNNHGEPPDGGWNVFKPGEVVARQAYRADAEFIAHAREDMPALVVEVERLQAIVNAHRLAPRPYG